MRRTGQSWFAALGEHAILLVFALAAFVGSADGSAAAQWVAINRSGATSVSLKDARAPVTVIIRTKVVGGASPCTVPGAREAKEASIINDLAISVGQIDLLVPSSVFADLVDANSALLTRQGAVNVLSIRGGDGAEAYIVQLYFDAAKVRRRTLSSLLMPDQPLEEARYWLRVLKDR